MWSQAGQQTAPPWGHVSPPPTWLQLAAGETPAPPPGSSGSLLLQAMSAAVCFMIDGTCTRVRLQATAAFHRTWGLLGSDALL